MKITNTSTHPSSIHPFYSSSPAHFLLWRLPPSPPSSCCVQGPTNSKSRQQRLITVISRVSPSSHPPPRPHIPSSKNTKGRAAVGLLHSLPSSFPSSSSPAPINLLITTQTETIFAPFHLPWSAWIFCSHSLSSCVFNVPFALRPPHVLHPSSPSHSPLFPSHLFMFPPTPRLACLAHCWALMSTLPRPVNYSITGRRISDPPYAPDSRSHCYSKNRFMLGMNLSQLIEIETPIVPAWLQIFTPHVMWKHWGGVVGLLIFDFTKRERDKSRWRLCSWAQRNNLNLNILPAKLWLNLPYPR